MINFRYVYDRMREQSNLLFDLKIYCIPCIFFNEALISVLFGGLIILLFKSKVPWNALILIQGNDRDPNVDPPWLV